MIDLVSHTTYVVCVCQKSAERKSPKKYFSYFVLISWPETRTLAFRLISQHLLDRGDFKSLRVNTVYFIRKIKIGDAPDYPTEQVRYVDEVQPYSLRNVKDFRIQQANTTAKQKSLFHKGLNL